jgi:hypothetical protein
MQTDYGLRLVKETQLQHQQTRLYGQVVDKPFLVVGDIVQRMAKMVRVLVYGLRLVKVETPLQQVLMELLGRVVVVPVLLVLDKA